MSWSLARRGEFSGGAARRAAPRTAGPHGRAARRLV